RCPDAACRRAHAPRCPVGRRTAPDRGGPGPCSSRGSADPGGSERPGQLARAGSDESTRPRVIWPLVSAVVVRVPPVSSCLNWPKSMSYLLLRPTWQYGRCGHSGGPPRTDALPEHLAAKSDSVLSPYLAAVCWVTAHASSSVACEASPKVSPSLVPSS